jgi:hypothetical protein
MSRWRPARISSLRLAAWVLAGLGVAVPAPAQTPPAAPSAQAPQAQPAAGLLKVFLDCNRCDEDYMRQNVAFVEYVRDRAVADVHVLVTTQETGGGGLSWVVKFIGLGRLQGQDRELTFSTTQTATDDDRRKEFARIFKILAVTYVVGTPVVSQLDVTFTKPAGGAQATPARDPWNFWVFRIEGNTFMNGEASSKSKQYRGSFSANRTTDRWKLNFNGNKNNSRDTFKVDEETTIVSTRNSWNLNALVVKSLTPKWSFGVRGSLSQSSFDNTDRQYVVLPGIEFDFFPYSESSRRLLTVQYSVGVMGFKYREITIYDKMKETIPRHEVNGGLGLKQPWGTVNVVSTFSQQMNKPSFYRLSTFGATDVRLFKGFSFNVFAEYDKINDQISLRKGEASTEEVLLRVRQLHTNYSYFVSIGVSYSFGSIFNSVVNPRFSGPNF